MKFFDRHNDITNREVKSKPVRLDLEQKTMSVSPVKSCVILNGSLNKAALKHLPRDEVKMPRLLDPSVVYLVQVGLRAQRMLNLDHGAKNNYLLSEVIPRVQEYQTKQQNLRKHSSLKKAKIINGFITCFGGTVGSVCSGVVLFINENMPWTKTLLTTLAIKGIIVLSYGLISNYFLHNASKFYNHLAELNQVTGVSRQAILKP